MIRLILVAMLVLSVQIGAPRAETPSESLISPERWLRHLNDDLLPFWTHADALGTPVGNFPSYRCEDGTVLRDAAPCPELAKFNRRGLKARVTVALSRQIFAYCVAFHMTGEPRFLGYAEAGIEVLFSHAIHPRLGVLAYFDPARRNARIPKGARADIQVESYALLGPAMYYALTRDAQTLKRIEAVKRKIFETYRDPKTGVFSQKPPLRKRDIAKPANIVTYLDQINAYMFLMTTVLDEPARSRWRAETAEMAERMIETFYSEKHASFVTDLEKEPLDGPEPPRRLGHAIKANWFLAMLARETGDDALRSRAEQEGRKIIERAFRDDVGAWSGEILPDEQMARNVSSWVYAEMDQFAASMAIAEPAYRPYLERSYAYWLENFVDHEHGGIWDWLDENDRKSWHAHTKHYPWKAGFHEFEHALVAYIAAAAIRGEPAELYYAFDGPLPTDATIAPYFFTAGAREIDDLGQRDGRRVVRVRFRDIGF